jgi:hypothetical protein
MDTNSPLRALTEGIAVRVYAWPPGAHAAGEGDAREQAEKRTKGLWGLARRLVDAACGGTGAPAGSATDGPGRASCVVTGCPFS